MKSKWIKPIGAAVMAAGLVIAYAETPSHSAANGQHRSENRQQAMEHRFERLSAYLNLTDAQKTQAKAIMKEAHESAMKFRPEMKQNREAMAQAIKTDKTADIERLAKGEGQLMGKTIAIRTEAFAKIYQTLTPEQRVKADKLPQHFQAQHSRSMRK